MGPINTDTWRVRSLFESHRLSNPNHSGFLDLCSYLKLYLVSIPEEKLTHGKQHCISECCYIKPSLDVSMQ